MKGLAQVVSTQAAVLTSADLFRLYMVLLLLLIPLVLCLKRIPAPQIPSVASSAG